VPAKVWALQEDPVAVLLDPSPALRLGLALGELGRYCTG